LSGIYLHIPFCRQACHYCDFHFSTRLSHQRPIVEAIAAEIGLQKNYLPPEPLQTVYFGGGTPSLLSQAELDLVFNALHQHFSLQTNCEITLEANPDDLTAEKIRQLRQTPISRLSIGIQSFHEPHLRFMNRSHTAWQAENCVKTAQDAGFENISADLIYAIPAETHRIWESDLEQTATLKIPHISAYCLTIEPKTVFGKWTSQGKLPPADESFAARQFETGVDFLEKQGLEQYEISSFALPGRYSRHNSSYWFGKPYLGVGPSAHSFNGISRQWNVANNALYLKNIQAGKLDFTLENLSLTDRINEMLLTRLRTKWGVELAEIQTLSEGKFLTENKFQLEKLESHDLIFMENNCLKLTKTGKLLADKITAALML
jgi:oxygen-independent coproporphyrinogen III oxidase